MSKVINLLTWFRVFSHVKEFLCSSLSLHVYAHTPKRIRNAFLHLHLQRLCKPLKISTRMTTKDDHPCFSTHAIPWACGWKLCSVYISLLGKIMWCFLKRKNIEDGCVLHINFARTGNKQPSGSVHSILLSKKPPSDWTNDQCLVSNPFSEIYPKWTTKQSANYWTLDNSLCSNTKFVIPTVKMHGMLLLNIDL